MHDNNLKTEEELQSWFIHDMERFFNEKGKEMIGWDEIIEGGLSKTATVMWWRSWVKDAATKTTAQGNPVIFTPNGQFIWIMQKIRTLWQVFIIWIRQTT